MKRTFFLAALLLAPACATAAPEIAPGAQGPVTIIADSDVASVDRRQNREGALAYTHAVAAPADRSWKALADVYQALGITVGTADSGTRTMGNRRLVIGNGRLAGVPLSTFLNCGSAEYGGLAADQYRVTLSVLSMVRPTDGGGSELSTVVSGTAVNYRSGQARAPVECGTTGELERRIARAVAESVAG